MTQLTLNLLTPSTFQITYPDGIFYPGSFLIEEISDFEDSRLLRLITDKMPVAEIYLSQNVLRIKTAKILSDLKSEAVNLAKEIKQMLADNTELFASNFDASQYQILENPQENEQIALQIQEVIKEQIAPALAAHGGSVEILKYEKHKLYVEFSGGCQGCSQVSATVKQGMETLLKQKFPKLRSIEDMTKHEQGENPYA